jgi:23S rRNA (guanosine2251-2'-O)-methyltransferase
VSDLPVVVGRRPALEAVRSGSAVELLVARGSRRPPGMRELLEAARRAGVPARTTSAEEVAALAEGARDQGVAARIRAPGSPSEADLGSRAWGPRAVVVVLDGISDPRNLGGIARPAEAAGAEALIVRRRRGAAMTPAAVRASAGALLHLPVAEIANVPRALARLKDAGFWAVGLDEAAPTPVGRTEPPPGPLALVLGSEGQGLSRLVREACDELASIPMAGSVASLNVSVAAGIALYALTSWQER